MTDPREVDELRAEVDFLCGLMVDGELENRVRATLRALVAENAQLRDDRDLCERTRANMRAILDGVAAAIKGTPEPLHAHDWSGLPDMARELRQQLAAARADTERLDWLEKAAFIPVYVDCNPPGTPCYLTWEHHERTACGESLRAAIDAAKGGA